MQPGEARRGEKVSKVRGQQHQQLQKISDGLDRASDCKPTQVEMSRDPLRKLKLMGRSLFRSLASLPATTNSTGSTTRLDRAAENKHVTTSEDEGLQRTQQFKQQQKHNTNYWADGKSRSQVELAGDDDGDDDDDNLVHADCCLPLSHLIVQQQRAVSGASPSKRSLSHLARLIGDKSCDSEPSVGLTTGANTREADNWLSDLQTTELAPEEEQQLPVQQQPKSQQQQQQQQPSAQPQLVADELVPASISSAPQSPQRGAVKRALSKGSRAGSRWSSAGEQKLDPMGKLILLLDKQDVRRASLQQQKQQQQQQQQQSSVMGSQMSDSTCDLPQVLPSSGQAVDANYDNNLFLLEESWRYFVKFPPISSSSPNQPPSSINAKQLVDGEVGEDQDLNNLQQQHRLANLKIQQDAIWELLTTEVFYIKRLKVIIDLFLATLIELQQHSLLVEINAKQVFSNIVEIYEANCSFWRNHLYPMLAKARSTNQPMDPVEMRNTFVQVENIFNPYYRYCLDHKACLSYFKEQNRSNECFKVYVAWCESQKDCERLRLMDLLAKPMQRLTRYSLLLKAISKKTDNQTDLKVLDNMIAHMNRFVLTVDLEMHRQEELELLMATELRIESIDYGADVYDDEIDRLLKSHYCHFNLNAPLFNCPFKCHRQLLYDSQLFTRGLQLGQIRFKDAQTSGKIEVVLLIFTDHLFVCRQSGPVSRWHRSKSSGGFNGAGGGSSQAQAQAAAGTSPGGTGSANRNPSAPVHRSPAGNGLSVGCQLLAGVADGHEQQQQQQQQQGYARPRAGSHQTTTTSGSGSAQASLRVYPPQHNHHHHHLIQGQYQHQQRHHHQPQHQTLSPRARSLILPDASIPGSGGGGTEFGGQVATTNQLGGGGCPSPVGRACSQTCVSLSVGSKFTPHIHQEQNLVIAQSQLATPIAAAAAAASPNCSRKSSGPSQRPSLDASSSSLAGNQTQTQARDFFRHSAESSRSGDNQAELHYLTTAVAATAAAAAGAAGSNHHHSQLVVSRQATTEVRQISQDSRLRAIRSPYPVERLVMHELKGGQGVFFCQLNDSLTIANSFVLYCSSASSSAILAPPAAAAAASSAGGANGAPGTGWSAVQRSSSDQQASAAVCPVRATTASQQQQHLRLARSNQPESSRSDSESQHLSAKMGRRDSESMNASRRSSTLQTSPARHLINLVKQAQCRYQLAANYHGISIKCFSNQEADELQHLQMQQPMQPLQVQDASHQTKSKLSSWSSFRQRRRFETSKTKNRTLGGLSNNQTDSLEVNCSTTGTNHREERAKLERRSASNELHQETEQQQQQQQQEQQARQIGNKQWQPRQPTRLASPLSKALFEQHQSMLLNHGQLEWPQSLEQVHLNAVPEACYGLAGGQLSVCGSGGPIGGSRAGSQSSVFDETSSCQRAATLQAPMEKHRSFSSPTSPKLQRHHYHHHRNGSSSLSGGPGEEAPSCSSANAANGSSNFGAGKFLEGRQPSQQLLSPNPMYPSVNFMGLNWSGSKWITAGSQPCSPASSRRHFSRSTRLSSNNQSHNPAHKELATSAAAAAAASSDNEALARSRTRSPLSANESNKSINSQATSFTSSDSEFSSTRSSSPFVGQIGRQRHTESLSTAAMGPWTNSPVLASAVAAAAANRIYQPIVVPSSVECPGGLPTTSGLPAGSSSSSQRRNSRRNLSSLRRQNVIISASSDQQQCQDWVLAVMADNNNNNNNNNSNCRPSDVSMQRQQLVAAGNNRLASGGNSSRDSSSMVANDTLGGPSNSNNNINNSTHLAPSSGRHRQFLAHHHYQTSSSQATTVDQTNSAAFGSADQLDTTTLPVVDSNQQQQQHQNLNAAGNNNLSGCSSSFELGHLGGFQKFPSDHHHHHQHRNSCSCADHTRSASMETRSPISVTLTLPEALPETNQPQQQNESRNFPSRATSPVYLSIPRHEAVARRGLLSPIDSVTANSPVCDGTRNADWTLEQDATDGSSWGSVAGGEYVDGCDLERVPELNIITTTSTTSSVLSTSGVGHHHQSATHHHHQVAERRRSSEALESASVMASAAGGMNTDWPRSFIRRRSSSNEEMVLISSFLSESSGDSQAKLALTSSREESINFFRRFLPQFRRRNYTSTQSQNNKSPADSRLLSSSPEARQPIERSHLGFKSATRSQEMSVGRDFSAQSDPLSGGPPPPEPEPEPELSEPSVFYSGEGDARTTAETLRGPATTQAELRVGRHSNSSSGGADEILDNNKFPYFNCNNLEPSNHQHARSWTGGPSSEGLASDNDNVGDATHQATTSLGLESQSAFIDRLGSASSSGGGGYLGFHEKLRLHNRRLEEERAAYRSTSARSIYPRGRWTTTRHRKARLVAGQLARHSASSANCIITPSPPPPPSESRPFRALNLTRSMTSDLFDSFLRATSLRSISGGSSKNNV